MKSLKLLVCLLFIGIKAASGQPTNKELIPGYYVVVGAYADTRESYASKFTASLVKKGYTAQYGFNSSRGLFFVYLNYFTSLKLALKSMETTRRSGKFVDAWVRVVPGYIAEPTKTAAGKTNEENKSVVVSDNNIVVNDKVRTESKLENKVADSTKSSYDSITENDEIKQYPQMTLGNTDVFLSLYNAANKRIVDGDVQVIDTERTRLITKVKGNEYLTLPDPKTTSGKLTLICDVLGYRKIQNEINYPIPLADTVKEYVDLVGTTLIINFDLVRYHTGDMTTLYNVYFYNDAAIMQPESKYELNNLLQLMQENSNYRIKLHGHTNGNHHGKILKMGPDKNFFSLAGAKESSGSSMGLSAARAEIIKDYLVSQGVDASRMEVKAWGGKRPLYDKHGVNARKNVRVEVEVLAE